MEYTISSRGRPIGTTELDFERIGGANRSGFFHPNALGEELMPSIALPYPAVRAYVCRDVRDADGGGVVHPSFIRSSMFADIAEALHRAQALELTLHDGDGRLIPTTEIGIQDTEPSRWKEVRCLPDSPDEDAAREAELQRELEYDIEMHQAEWEDGEYAEFEAMVEDVWRRAQALYPRYQVHVLLAEESSIP